MPNKIDEGVERSVNKLDRGVEGVIGSKRIRLLNKRNQYKLSVFSSVGALWHE
jgi:hypothetical protein